MFKQNTYNDLLDLAMSMTQNAALAKTIRDLAIPQVTYMTIANDAGDAMNVKMITPADFESNGNVKYPVIFNPYD